MFFYNAKFWKENHFQQNQIFFWHNEMILEIRIYFSFILHFLPYVFFVEIRFWFLTVKVIWPFLPIGSGGPHSRTFIKFASCGGQLCILRSFKSLLGIPPIHLIFEISSLKNLVRQTGIFCLFRTRFLQATQAVKV